MFPSTPTVPSAPPRDIILHMLGNNTLRLSWATPASEHHNGPLRGYKIFLHGNETKFSRNITTNASVHSVVISHLVTTISYGVQMAAFNRMGVGARSRMQDTGEGWGRHMIYDFFYSVLKANNNEHGNLLTAYLYHQPLSFCLFFHIVLPTLEC